MLARIRGGLTFSNVCSFLALTIALGTGGAYAANTVFSSDIVDGEVKTADIANSGVGNLDLAPNSVGTGKVIDNTLTAADIATGAVGTSELADDGVTAADLAAGAVSGEHVATGSLTGTEIDESTLGRVPAATDAQTLDGADRLDVASTGLVNAPVSFCDPTSTTVRTICATFTVHLPRPSDVLVMATAQWFGVGTGIDKGNCRIDLGNATGRAHAYGQKGNEHDDPNAPGTLAQNFIFQGVAAGSHTGKLSCVQSDGDFRISNGLVNAVRLSP